MVSEREAKSVSAEETFDVDVTDPARLRRELDLLAARVAGRLRANGLAGRTVNIKVRHGDFTTVTRAFTRDHPTDDGRLVAHLARRLLTEVDTSGGIRLLGVGVSTLADFAQDDLFSETDPAHDLFSSAPALDLPDEPAMVASPEPIPARAGPPVPDVPVAPSEVTDSSPTGPDAEVPDPPTDPEPVGWRPGQDVLHDEQGPGWVQGSGLGRVTVRFEGPQTARGPVRTFAVDDPRLHPTDPPSWVTA